MAGQPNIKLPTLNNLVIPLPPKAEQEIIVQKVQQLLKNINTLQAQVQQSLTDADLLLQVVLQEAFKGKEESL